MTSVTASLYTSGKYSDLLIKCKGKEFKVHRAVVCVQSEPLAAAVDGKFQEAITGEIDLDGNEPEIVECMLKYMYTQDYSDGRIIETTVTASATPTPVSSKKVRGFGGRVAFVPSSYTTSNVLAASDHGALLTNTKVYIIGDQLQINDLKILAKKKYEEVVKDRWNSASFVSSLSLLYEETLENDRLMKDIAIKTAGEHAKELCDRGEFVVLCKKNGEIAFDVLKASLTAKAPLKTCPNCQQNTCVQQVAVNSFNGGELYCDNCGEYFN